jgi:hypothetical protein
VGEKVSITFLLLLLSLKFCTYPKSSSSPSCSTLKSSRDELSVRFSRENSWYRETFSLRDRRNPVYP